MKLFRKDLARDYALDVREIDRWRHDKILPKPSRTPAGRPYWTPEQIAAAEQIQVKMFDAAEKKRAANAAKLLKRKQLAAVNPRQALPLQVNLPFKF